MTGVRQSFVFALEKEFKGDVIGTKWIRPPPGSYLSTGHSRGATKINTEGCKTWDTVAYGQLTGSWEWTFTLDYDYLEPFYLAFEDYDVEANVDGKTYTHTFKKSNNGIVPSFTIRRKVLNNLGIGGGQDEIVELKGCVLRNLSFSKGAGASQTSVTMTGFYATETMYLGDLEMTDYTPYEGHLTEHMCMYVADEYDTKEQAATYNYVAKTDSLQVSIENSSNPLYSTCSAFAVKYYEGYTNYSFGTSCYSDDPERYKLRVYGGGSKATKTGSTTGPMNKGLTPLKGIKLIAYDGILDEGCTLASAKASTKTFTFTITDCVIKSLTWAKGDGQVLQDKISSCDCRLMELEVKTDVGNFDMSKGDTRNQTVISPDPE